MLLDALVRRVPPARRLRAAHRRRAFERHVVRSMTDDAPLFASSRPLPPGYGAGFSERAVEYGWALAQEPRGVVLDAGSSFNHPYVLDVLVPRARTLTIVTLAPETSSYPERGIEYRYHDLRELPFADGSFDTVLCMSVLEHVGLDTSMYGHAAPPARDPQREAVRAMRELVRVTASGGRLLISVPYGRATVHEWVRTLDEAQIGELLDAAGARSVGIAVFRDRGAGWQRSSLEDAADAGFRDYWAEAVACARLTI